MIFCFQVFGNILKKYIINLLCRLKKKDKHVAIRQGIVRLRQTQQPLDDLYLSFRHICGSVMYMCRPRNASLLKI